MSSTKLSLLVAGMVVVATLVGVSLQGSPLGEQIAIYTLAPIGRVLGGMRSVNCISVHSISVERDSRGTPTTIYRDGHGNRIVHKGQLPLPGAKRGMTIMQRVDYFGRTTTELYRGE